MRVYRKTIRAAVLLLIVTAISFAQLSGTKTVGTGGDYTSIGAAITALNANGVSGPVVFSLTDAAYSETGASLLIKVITNVPTVTNTITFKPASGISPVVTINGCSSSAGSAQYNGFTDSCTSYITIDGANSIAGSTRDLTFLMNDAVNGRNILALYGNCDNITVKNTKFIYQAVYNNVNAADVTSAINVVGQTSGAVDNLTIENCQIANSTTMPNYGISITGYITAPVIYGTTVVVKNNDVTSRWRGIYFRYIGATGKTSEISGNTVTSPSTTFTYSVYGIQMQTVAGTTNVLKNKVITLKSNVAASASYGIFGAGGVPSTVINIANNFVADIYNTYSTTVPTPAQYAMCFGSTVDSGTYNIYHNTLTLPTNCNVSGNVVGLYISSYANVTFKNNIIVNNYTSTSTYGIYKNSATSTLTANYNDIYIPSAIGKYGYFAKNGVTGTALRETFAEWKDSTSQDANSDTAAIVLASSTNLHLSGASIGNPHLIGVTGLNVTTDIDDEVRSTTYPYKGADENITTPLVPVPAFTASSLLIDFGTLRKTRSKTDSVVVQNSGVITLNITGVTSDVADFTVTPTTASVAPSASQKFYITYTATNAGLQTANIRFANNGTKTADTVVVKGTCIYPVVTIRSKNINQGNVSIGTTKRDSLYVVNSGTDTLRIDSLYRSKSVFTISRADTAKYSVAPSDSQKVYVTFAPVSAGTVNDTLIIYHDALNMRDTIYLSAIGVQSQYSARQKNIAFGGVLVSGTKKDSLYIVNSGAATLKIDSVIVSNAKFVVTPVSGTITAGDSLKYSFTYSPTSTGSDTGKAVFYHNGSSLRDTVILTGKGIQAIFSFAPSTLAFKTQIVGQNRKDSVTVSNVGTSALTISGVTSTSPDFSISPLSATIDTGKTQKFFITFTPSVAGLRSGKIAFAHNGASKDTLSASGSGIAVGTLRLAHNATNGTEVAFEGIATRVKGNYTYMQDTSYGMVMYISSGPWKDSVTSGGIKVGDKIRVIGKVSEYNSLKEVVAADLYNFTVTSRNNALPAAKIVTLAKLVTNGEDYEGQLIKVVALKIVAGTDTVYASAKSYSITDPSDTTKTIVLRIPNATDNTVAGKKILTKLVTFTGVLGQFNSSNPAAGYQMMATDSSDITDNLLFVQDLMDMIPTEYQLAQNYPNPFNPSTTIQYGLPKQSNVTVKIYSVLGQEVKTLVNNDQSPSFYRVVWNGTDNNGSHVGSGVYFIRITAQSSEPNSKPFMQVKKMLLMK